MPSSAGRKVLVTGARGFLGRHVARRFAAAGFTVFGAGHGEWASSDHSAYGISTWHQADITLEWLTEFAGEPYCVVHCAGSSSVGFSLTNPLDDFNRSVLTTIAVLDYVRLAAPQTVVVLPSSAAVYGSAKVLPNVETAHLQPASPYGVHKVIAENLCQSYATHFNTRIAIVRLFSLYGDGLRKQLIWDACRKLDSGATDFSGSGEELRDWLHVEDAADLMHKAALNASPQCPVVNGGSGQGVSVREVLSMLSRARGTSEPVRFTGEQRVGDPIGYQASTSAAKLWGWEPRIPLNEGLLRYVKWFKGLDR